MNDLLVAHPTKEQIYMINSNRIIDQQIIEKRHDFQLFTGQKKCSRLQSLMWSSIDLNDIKIYLTTVYMNLNLNGGEGETRRKRDFFHTVKFPAKVI